MKKIWYLLLITTWIIINLPATYAADKKGKTIIYVKNFTIDGGLNANDPIKNQVKELIQEEFEKNGNFFITADADITALMNQEEKAQSLGKCSSEGCIQELMEKINAQIIVFGRIRKIDGFTYITARYMDSTSGVPRVSKIRTIKYRYNDFLEKGVRALAEYLITGDDDEVTDFMDEVYTREERDISKKNSVKEEGLENQKELEYKKKVELAAKEREKGLVSRSPGLRFGYGFYMSAADEDVNDSFTEQYGYFVDLVFGDRLIFDDHLRNDWFFRFAYKTYRMNDASIKSDGVIGKDVINKSEANLYAVDLGFKIKASKYFMITAFNPYILAAFRTGYYQEKATDKYDGSELKVGLFGYGGYVGAGIEFAFFENLGFFAEYNTGVFNLGDSKINFEGQQVYGGVTLRSQF